MKYEYSVHIAWSKEDEAYIALVHELQGCMADGPTPEEALSNIRQVAREWVEVAKEEGRPIPPPMSCEDQVKAAHEFREEVNKQIKQAVEQIIANLIESESVSEPWS